MLIAPADNPQKPVTSLGSTVWSMFSPAPGQPETVAVKAEADIPDLKMHPTMILRKNTDPTLQATHTIDLKFSFADGAPFNGFKDVGLPQMRKEDSTVAEMLTSVKVKISDVYFLIALAKGDSDTARNLDLMQTRAWFDFPLLLNDNRIAKVVFQKSLEGEAMLAKAFDMWGETPASAPEQDGRAQPPLNQPSPDDNTQATPPAAAKAAADKADAAKAAAETAGAVKSETLESAPAAAAKARMTPPSTAPRSDEVGAKKRLCHIHLGSHRHRHPRLLQTRRYTSRAARRPQRFSPRSSRLPPLVHFSCPERNSPFTAATAPHTSPLDDASLRNAFGAFTTYPTRGITSLCR
jgi:hypothetical protein